ncbi:hypothetical protein JM93_00997, partial [Roseibium hamelinense]
MGRMVGLRLPPPDKQKTCPRPFALPLYLPRLLKGLRGGPS